MTIPAVLNHIKETQMKTGLKKAQSVLSEALQLMIYETGIIPNIQNYTTQTLLSVFKTYLSQLKSCGTSGCIKNAANESEKANGNYVSDIYMTYNGATNAYSNYFDDGQLILADGMILLVENTRANAWTFLSIDINGLNKPNKWGHDLFTFEIDSETGALLPMGHPDSSFNDENTYCSKTSSNNKNGIACTYKALTEKDYFKNLP